MIWIIILLVLIVIVEGLIITKFVKRELHQVYIPFNTDYKDKGYITIDCSCSGKTLCFIIDTGCSRTSITGEALKGVSYKKCRRKTEAFGVVGDRYELILRSINITIAQQDFEVFCYEMKTITSNLAPDIAGLLGTDFFDKYNWIIDYKHERIIIK
ncbi:hypothetical protein [uncultured Butyricimonas sp.]|uniref:hypothetical protein n=1 Tax=uncultured Butyricimonas sp. TaxID=1268785 RepID=UPI0026DA9900|nr:hypothetical protein [uncultured Butyricimonas sp.]